MGATSSSKGELIMAQNCIANNEIVLGDATKPWPVRKESVDVIVTSPPYWQHRDNGPLTTTIFDGNAQCDHIWKEPNPEESGCFCKKCNSWKGQLGQESNPDDYIKHLADIFNIHGKEALKPTGQLWVNLGDCYSKDGKNGWVQKKQKLMIPERFAIAMQNRGWVVRNDIIWAKSVMFSDQSSKGGSMPSSVHDRFTNSHEYFYFFIKPFSCRRTYYLDQTLNSVSWTKPKSKNLVIKDYFSSIDNVRIKPIWVNSEGQRIDFYGRLMGSRPNAGGSPKQHAAGQPHLYMTNHPLGKNPGSVWQFHTEPFEGEHNSPYPPKLIQWIIRFASPKMTCPKCGLPEEVFYERKEKTFHNARCKCDSKLQPALIFDPFMGSGSTAIAALNEKRFFSGIELNPTHLEISKKRISDEFPKFANKNFKFTDE
jgi:site-specific DNA-methyltransferase (adenine-specific)